MVIDYLFKVESMNIESLNWQERESLVTVLNYLGKRERNPYLLDQINKSISRLVKIRNFV